MTSPLSNAEKHADGSSRDVEFRRERDDMPKGYDRDRREPISAQRKGMYLKIVLFYFFSFKLIRLLSNGTFSYLA